MKTYGTTRCNDCDQDITDKAQYFDNEEVYCENCNYRKGGNELPCKV